MKKGNIFKYSKLSKYIKLAVVLLLDAVPVWFVISVTTADDVDSDFLGFGLMVMFFLFVIFNLWAAVLYFITKPIKRIWLRECVFYLVLLLSSISPLIVLNLT